MAHKCLLNLLNNTAVLCEVPYMSVPKVYRYLTYCQGHILLRPHDGHSRVSVGMPSWAASTDLSVGCCVTSWPDG